MSGDSKTGSKSFFACTKTESVGYRWRGSLFRLTASSHAPIAYTSVSTDTLTSTLSILPLFRVHDAFASRNLIPNFREILNFQEWKWFSWKSPRVQWQSIRVVPSPAQRDNKNSLYSVHIFDIFGMDTDSFLCYASQAKATSTGRVVTRGTIPYYWRLSSFESFLSKPFDPFSKYTLSSTL